MKLKREHLSYIALFAGLAGTIVNYWAQSLPIDKSGLFPATHASFIILYILSIAMPVGFFLLLRDLKGELPHKALFPADPLSTLGYVTAALNMMSVSVAGLSQASSTLSSITNICGIFSAASFGLVGYFRWKQQRPHYLFHAVITIGIMLYLISCYQEWNTQTQLQTYLPQLLALLTLMLCLYQRTALDADTGSRRVYAFFNYCALPPVRTGFSTWAWRFGATPTTAL